MKITKRTLIDKQDDQFIITVKWMHGDADGYSETVNSFPNEAAFLKAWSVLTELDRLQNKFHNLFCDIRQGCNRKKALANPEVKELYDKFFKSEDEVQYCDFTCDIYDAIGIEHENDVKYEDSTAALREFHGTEIKNGLIYNLEVK